MIDPILITGCARSGTSLTAGIIDICGAFGGDTAGPNINNKRGMFENVSIRNGIIKPYLQGIGADRLGQNPLPSMEAVRKDSKDKTLVSRYQKRIHEVFMKHGYQDGPWYYKGAKMCLIWPFIHAMFPNAKWVIVRRNDEDIVNSCMKTNFMRAYNRPEGWQRWINHHKERFEEMKEEPSLDCVEFWPSTIFDADLEPIRDLVTNYLNLEWKEKEIWKFASPALWSSNKRR